MTRPQPDVADARPEPGEPAPAETKRSAGSSWPADPAARLALEPGACPLPDYRLLQFLGRGGFGEVWKAAGPGGFAVALKFIRLGELAGAAEERAAELLKTKEIRHPNLLTLFGSWRRDDVLVLAMELADRTLSQRLGEALGQGLPGVPFAELLEYLREAAKGLDHLHAVGVQHRDVKPQNLLLAGGGVKVSDFGLAKVLEETSAVHSGGMTPAYAAPELLEGVLSVHSDQYALAVAYCQLRGGRLPFGGTAAQMIMSHLHQAPDLTMLPKAERPAVARALAKDPHRRWPSCRDFVEALAPAAATAPYAVPPAPTLPASLPSRRPWLALTLAGGLLLLAALAALSLVRVGRTPPAKESDGPPPAPAVSAVSDAPHTADTAVAHPGSESPADPKEITNTVGMRLAPIPAGKFVMGSPKEEIGRYASEGPQHEVTITRPFYLGVHPVTKGQFAAFVEAQHYQTEAEADGRGGHGYDAAGRTLEGPDPKYTWKDTGFPQTGDDPAVNVSWNDAMKFCEWLSRKENKVYTLPTEAEWEYACRAGTTTRFWCGDDDGSLNGAENVRDAALKAKLDADRFRDWTFGGWDDGFPFTSPVGKFRPNPWGLYDMEGNVWQWCADRYGKYPDGPATDPTGPAEGELRVLRGGSWRSAPAFCRSAARHSFEPADCGADVGFRVVLRPAPTP